MNPDLEKPYQQLGFIKCLKQNDKEEGRKYANITKEKNSKNFYADFILATTEESQESQI